MVNLRWDFAFTCDTPYLALTGEIWGVGREFYVTMRATPTSLRWRHNGRDSASNHQPHGCLLNRLFRRISKTASKPRVTSLCVGNSQRPVNSPHKWPVTRKMFPFDDVIMLLVPCNSIASPHRVYGMASNYIHAKPGECNYSSLTSTVVELNCRWI